MKRYRWKTKDGKVLFVDEMKDSHLLNAHRLVSEKKRDLSEGISAAYSVSAMFIGEMALDQAEREIRDMEDAEEQCEKSMQVLTQEIEKRGLKPLSLREHKPAPFSQDTLIEHAFDKVLRRELRGLRHNWNDE